MDEEQQNNTQPNNELEELKKQNEEYLNNWKRERADFINYKKNENEKLDRRGELAKKIVIEDFLEIKDDLEKALKANQSPKDMEDKGYLDGVKMTLKKFEDILHRYKVQKIPTNREFNPNIHEAVEMEPDGEKIVEIRTGYTMDGEMIRPAKIKITK